MKRIEDSLRDLWDNIKWTNIHITGVPEEEEKEKGMRKYLKRLQLKTSLTWERNCHPSRGSSESHIQGKFKEEHAKTHTNQTDKN